MSPVSGSFITTGSWTSQTCQRTLGGFRTGFNSRWGLLRLRVELGDSESSVKVDILDSLSNLLESNITLVERTGGYREADLSVLPNVREEDIKVKIKLEALDQSPSVDDVTLTFAEIGIS